MSFLQSRFYQQLSVVSLVACFGLYSSLCLAQSSTAIRLESIDFGGHGLLRQQDSQQQDGRQEHNSYKHRHGTEHHYGIKGHRSFGLTSSGNGEPHAHHHDNRQQDRQHLPGYLPRHGSWYSHRSGIYLNLLPLRYSYDPALATGGSRPAAYQQPPYRSNTRSDEVRIDAWAALGNYQINTALHGFEMQIKSQPYSALPRVGYALCIALSGDIENGAFAMQQALLADLTDLHYFRPDVEQQLIVEELLLSYEDNPLVSALLHYLNQDYTAAKQSLTRAKQDCHDCALEDKLTALIERR